MADTLKKAQGNLAQALRNEKRAMNNLGDHQERIQELKSTIDALWTELEGLVADKSKLSELLRAQALVRQSRAVIVELEDISAQ